MIKDLQVTLYEIFGYLLPGIILFSSLILMFWAFFSPTLILSFDLKTPEVWLGFLVLSYVTGHMGQAIGNLFEKSLTEPEKVVLGNGGRLSPEILKACKLKAEKTFGINSVGLDEIWLFRLCDDAVLRSGKLGEREIFQYREGFYKGIVVGFAALAIASTVLMIRLCFGDNHCLKIKGIDWEISLLELIYVQILSIIFTCLGFWRYRRFGVYRVSHALLGFLTLKDDKKSDIRDVGQI